MSQFCFYNSSGFSMAGRLMNSYSPYGASNLYYENRTLGWYNAGHPLMADVTEVSEYFTTDVTIENDAETVASWDNSFPFVAYKPDHDVVALNGYIGDNNSQYTGDMMTIVHNAINFLRGTTGVNDDIVNLPNTPSLSQNYPNPFNPATMIEFDLPSKTEVSLEVFNILGQKVATLAEGVLDAGHHSITFDASELGSGTYFYRLDAGDHSETKKMTILK